MYSKIFRSMLDSSIWLEDTVTRLVWVTMLILMNQDGFVRAATIRNLALRANLPVDQTESAVKVLEAPDPDSGDPEFDGRRIERVPGGWMVLNAKKYDKVASLENERSKTRKRVARHRERQAVKAKSRNDDVTQNHQPPSET